jgi:squalene-hopene/tetraprenyl-beta-curcumene cyclase
VLRAAEAWIIARTGTLDPKDIAKAVIARYGKDKTFSVPILMLCSLCGTLGEKPWRHVIALPFELAALPRTWFGAIGLPVVSYALPALIAIGHVRFQKAPPAWWNPLRWLRALAWKRVRPMLQTLQPSSGGYLEATPLTSFVTMALAGAGDLDHPCLPLAVAFLRRSMRDDGSWPIDTNLATWGTTLAVRALGKKNWHGAWARDSDSSFQGEPDSASEPDPNVQCGTPLAWLLNQQYRDVHPFTNAAPGGWAWTDLPGGVPDADDTSSALIALKVLVADLPSKTPWSTEAMQNPSLHRSKASVLNDHVVPGIVWLLDIQNRDGGIPTFCRGWGTLPFDRSTPEITAHALLAWWSWHDKLHYSLQARIQKATKRAIRYLERVQLPDGSWLPLWFGNEQTSSEMNPVYGTSQVMNHLLGEEKLFLHAWRILKKGNDYLLKARRPLGAWGGDANAPASIEETAVAIAALCHHCRQVDLANRREQIHASQGFQYMGEIDRVADQLTQDVLWLLEATAGGTRFPSAPIGLYFARLWYHETLYPVIWTLEALRAFRTPAVTQDHRLKLRQKSSAGSA